MTSLDTKDTEYDQSAPQTTPPCEVIIIEDHNIFRKGLALTLETLAHFKCVGAFSNMEDALAEIDAGLTANIVLLDLGLPGMDGISGIIPLRERLPDTRVIVLTAFTDREKVFAALEAGAHGYLIKATNPNSLIQTLDEVAKGGTPLDPQIAGMVLNTFQKLNPIRDEEKLGNRELEILQLVAEGMTKAAIAVELGISPHTVADYTRRVFDKLHVHSLPAAVSAAMRRGLLDFSDHSAS